MKKQSTVEAGLLLASHSVSLTYSQRSSLRCTDPSVGRLREKIAFSDVLGIDAKDVRLIFPGEHLDACRDCREAMIDHASRIALKEVATEKGLSIDEAICELGRVAIALRQDAGQRGVPLRVLVEELLAKVIRS